MDSCSAAQVEFGVHVALFPSCSFFHQLLIWYLHIRQLKFIKRLVLHMQKVHA